MDILIVDDEAVMLESIRIGLESNGHRVFMACSAKEGMDLLYLNRQRIDMIVADYMMPEMDGIEFLKVIRRNHPALPVILITSFADNWLRAEARKNHCDCLIERPISLDQLLVEIKRIKRRTDNIQHSNEALEAVKEITINNNGKKES